MTCEAGLILRHHVPRKHGRIEVDVIWKGKRIEICSGCWRRISATNIKWGKKQ